MIAPKMITALSSLSLKMKDDRAELTRQITLLDRASWHTSDPLVVPENIRLIPQLAGSPELSPTEHVWDDLREKEMANHAFESLDQVEDSLCKGINRLCDNPEYLKKMTNLPYLNRNFLDAT